MITLLATLFVLGILVFIHELGHFLAAKRVGIRVEQFSLGFPPKMIGKKIGETEYRLSWLPVGGYVKMAGQDDFRPEAGEGKPWEFYSKPGWAQALVIAAGPLTNWFFSFFLFWMLILVSGISVTRTTTIGAVTPEAGFIGGRLAPGDRILSVNGTGVATWEDFLEALQDGGGEHQIEVAGADGGTRTANFSVPAGSLMASLQPFLGTKIGSVLEGHPAAAAGMTAGDSIVAVGGDTVRQWTDLVALIHGSPGESLTVAWTRGGLRHETVLVTSVRQVMDTDRQIKKTGMIGITPYVEHDDVGILTAARMGLGQTVRWTGRIFSFVRDLVTGRASMRNVGGPIAIARMAGQSARSGVASLVAFMAILGINLAVINILPVPMFDGGHLVVIIAEAVTRRKLSFKQKSVIQYIGLALILGLTVLVLFNDVVNLIRNI